MALFLGAILAAPSLFIGFTLDDCLHWLFLEDPNHYRPPFDLFDFVPGDAEHYHRLVDNGPYPWWSHPELKMAFLRPVASLQLAADHALFHRWALPYHIHSLCWYLLFIVACGLVFRRVAPGPVAGLALILCAMDDAHALSVSWVANRCAVESAAMGMFCLWGHLRWRQDGWRPGMWVAMAGFLGGMLSSESTIGVLGYVTCYELLAGPGRARERVKALMPLLGVFALHSIAYIWLDYGAYASSNYISPTQDTLRFALHLPGRILGLLSCQFMGIPAEAWMLSRWPVQLFQVIVGLAGTGLMLALLRGSWPRFGTELRRNAPWIFVGSILALVPVSAALPSSRLLMFSSAGSALLVAGILHDWWTHRREASGLWHPAACWLLVVIHGALPLAVWPVQDLVLTRTWRTALNNFDQAELDETCLTGQEIVLINGPDPLTALWPPVVRCLQGRPMPGGWRVLSMAPCGHRVTRTGPNALHLEVIGGRMLGRDYETMFRDAAHPLRPGEKVVLPHFEAEVLEMEGPCPTAVAFRWDRPLEDDGLCFLHWHDGLLRRFPLPGVGESVTIEYEPGLVAM